MATKHFQQTLALFFFFLKSSLTLCPNISKTTKKRKKLGYLGIPSETLLLSIFFQTLQKSQNTPTTKIKPRGPLSTATRNCFFKNKRKSKFLPFPRQLKISPLKKCAQKNSLVAFYRLKPNRIQSSKMLSVGFASFFISMETRFNLIILKNKC